MQGKVIIFSAPSGAGKTTIVKNLLKDCDNLEFSISATTRSIRPNEKNAIDYYFLSVDEFKHKIQNNDFIEWEEVYPNQFYGTLKTELERIWNNGKVVLFDIDVKGGINIKKLLGDAALSIFVKAPSIEELHKRIIGRNTETPETLKKRISKAEEEMTFADQFDVLLINDDLEKAIYDAKNIITDFLKS